MSKALDELSRLCLVEVDTNGNPTAHRLILAFARHQNAADCASAFEQCRQAIQTQMRRAFENPGADTIRELESIVPHAELLRAGNRLRPEEFIDLAGGLGEHHRTCGRYMDARRAFTGALEIAEKMFKPDHPSIANGQSDLATVLRRLGHLEEACDLMRKALASDEKTFAPGHPSIAIRQSNLALVLRDMGHLDEARDLLREAYRAYLDRFGPDHPKTRTIKRNLASLRGEQSE